MYFARILHNRRSRQVESLPSERGTVDGKLTCPICVARHRSGSVDLRTFSSLPRNESVTFASGPTIGRWCDPWVGLSGRPPGLAPRAAHPLGSGPNPEVHDTPPESHQDTRGLVPWPLLIETDSDRKRSGDSGSVSAPYCHSRRCACPAHRGYRRDASRFRTYRTSPLPPSGPQSADGMRG